MFVVSVRELGIEMRNQQEAEKMPPGAVRLLLESSALMLALFVKVAAPIESANEQSNSAAILTIIARPERWKRGFTGVAGAADNAFSADSGKH